ncbi:hypothetical protein ACLOJK_001171 [Asimina triloba]
MRDFSADAAMEEREVLGLKPQVLIRCQEEEVEGGNEKSLPPFPGCGVVHCTTLRGHDYGPVAGRLHPESKTE